MSGTTTAGRRPVAAVVVTFRSARFVADCIDALRIQCGAADRVIVVDNAGGDDTPAVARACGAEVLSLETNIGFGSACNRGAALAPGLDVLLVNPDAVVQPGAIEALRRAMTASPRCAAVGPRIERGDGMLEPGCRRSFPRPLVAMARLTRLNRALPRSRFLGAYNLLGTDAASPGPIEAGSGAGLLVRRDVWDALGGFDERFFMYGEDLDLCRRIADLGHQIWYEPAARLVHAKGASTHQVPFRMLWHFHRAMWIYYAKHHSRGGAILLAPAVLAGITARLAVLGARNALRPSRSRVV